MSFGVLVVCVGNICRSPLGERLLSARLDPGRFTVRSAGVRAVVGSGMDPQAQALLEEYGGSAEGFAARQLTPAMVREAGVVLTATREIRGRVLEESPSALRRTFTVRELGALLEADTERREDDPAALVRRLAGERSRVGHLDLDIPDPIGQNADTHRVAAEMMARSIEPIGEAWG